jgi:CDP-glucose 4,6-dehydratase
VAKRSCTVEEVVTLPQQAFWQGKRVLLTGHTGFKGGWLTLWLRSLGAQVVGLSLPPDGEPNLFKLANIAAACESRFVDLRDADQTAAAVRAAKPDIVLHLAAQALVRASYADPLATFSTNVMGTAHVLNALRDMPSVKVAIVVTTDKVYQNNESLYPYREVDPLGGHDPYSASKAAAEIVVASYRLAFLEKQGVAVATARAGNVIGGGDWSVDRLIPDAVRAWGAAKTLTIRRPEAVRPWQHVLEPLSGYLRLAQVLWYQPELAAAYNFGPETSASATVRHVVELARAAYGTGDVEWGDDTEGPHEAGLLALEIVKARVALGVVPRWDLSSAIVRTMHWYQGLAQGKSAEVLCREDIVAYEAER